jgi:hypothetical protein
MALRDGLLPPNLSRLRVIIINVVFGPRQQPQAAPVVGYTRQTLTRESDIPSPADIARGNRLHLLRPHRGPGPSADPRARFIVGRSGRSIQWVTSALSSRAFPTIQ